MTIIHQNSDTSTFVDTLSSKSLQSVTSAKPLPTMPHLVQWVEGSKVSLDIALLNIESLTAEEVNKRVRLKTPIKSDGWWCSGVQWRDGEPAGNLYGQVRLDNPPTVNKKELRYLTAAGSSVDAVFLAMPDKLYWAKIHADKTNPRHWAEGVKKAGAGLTLGFPTIALTGVWNWGKDGELARWVSEWAEPETTHYISFDSDYDEKSSCRAAILEFGRLLIERGCIVYIVTWDKKDKGMDDFIKAEGGDAYKAAVANAVTLAQWEQQFKSRDTSDSPAKSKKPPTPREIAARLAEQYGHQWKYSDEQKTWRVDSGKHWEKIGLGAFTSLVKTTIDAKDINYTGSAYIKDVVELLQCDLRQIRWQYWDRKRFINFNNCVLDGEKLTTLEYSPGMGFTSFLPFDYKPLAGDLSDALETLRVNCPSIHKFFRTAMQDDERKMLKLLAICNAILKHRFFDLQMFVHLVGAPGSGKGTFARLMEKLVGRENFKGCQLDRLSDGSTKASVVDKQLVVFADERKPVGIDSILSFTGGDAVSYRELHTPAADAFFYGCFLICSNKPIFVGDTTGLERRLCLVHFDNPIPTEKRDHSIENQFEDEIPALIGIALSLSDLTVTQAVRGIGSERIAKFKAKEWEMKCETDSIAAFFDSELVIDPTATTPVGKFYERYKYFCEEGGLKTFSVVKFPRMLASIGQDEGLPIQYTQGRIATFQGLRLREKSDTHPTHSETLAGVIAPVSGGLAGVDAGVKPARDINQRELREFAAKYLRESANDDDYLFEAEEGELEIDLSPSTPADVLPARDTTPASTPAEVVQTPPQTPANVGSKHQDIKEGDRVVITEEGVHKGQYGTVTYIGYGSREIDYQVLLDKESHFVRTVTVSIPKSVLMNALYLMKL